MGHYVYKYILDEEIIYIGKNDTNLSDRIYFHEHTKTDSLYGYQNKYPQLQILFTEVENKIQSELLESLLIDKYKPVLNKAKKYDGTGFIFKGAIEPEFVIYTVPEKAKATVKSSKVKTVLDSKHKFKNHTLDTISDKELRKNKALNMAFIMSIIEQSFNGDFHKWSVSNTEFRIPEHKLPCDWRDIENPLIEYNYSDGGWGTESVFESVRHYRSYKEIELKIKQHITIEQIVDIKNKYIQQYKNLDEMEKELKK